MAFVYFIREEGGGGPVKIGTSYQPRERLAALAAWSPRPLEIVASLHGGSRLEGRFHTLFVAQHSHHEWFRPSAEMDAVIEAIRDGTFDTDSLPIGPSALRGHNAAKSHAARRQRLEAV